MRQRHTKSRVNRGRSHQALKFKALTPCRKCKTLIMPHMVCWSCGFYKGVEYVDVLARLDKKGRKKKEAEIKAKEETKKAAPLSAEALSRKT